MEYQRRERSRASGFTNKAVQRRFERRSWQQRYAVQPHGLDPLCRALSFGELQRVCESVVAAIRIIVITSIITIVIIVNIILVGIIAISPWWPAVLSGRQHLHVESS